MKELYPLPGIVAVLNTPFTEDDRVDRAGLMGHVRYAVDAGVAGFLVPAMAAEVYKLNAGERRLLVEATLEANAGRATVIGGAGSVERGERLRLVKDLMEAGCRNVLLQIPFTDRENFREEVLRVADLGPEMLMIQDWDSSGGGLPLDVICALFEEVEAFRCLKVETVPAGAKYSQALEATGGRLHVSGGWAVAAMIEGLERGVHAFMPTGLYEVYCLIFRLFHEGAVEEAEAWFRRVLPVLAFSNQHLDISIHFFKRLLHRQGIYATSRVREPILEFDAVHEKKAGELIDYAMGLMGEASQPNGWKPEVRSPKLET